MTKKKVSLSNRKRLSELQAESAGTIADEKRQTIALMSKVDFMPKDKIELTLTQMAADASIELIDVYKKWCEPLNANRFRYSPNERNKRLLQQLKKMVNEVGEWAAGKGVDNGECISYCQQFVDELCEILRSEGIPVGQLHLRQSPK
ncbi:MAG: hypothetical protein ACO2ZM_07830 [Francisellaceae bacterium]